MPKQEEINMAEDLPAPKSRKEEYLATAAGMTGIELPEPASREEIYLDAIAQGGGGGGSSYTAGDGIDITNNEISVDTETIQPKLTAGTNITIDGDNVISAEGGGPIVVQTTGTSTTDVMSQDATTKMVFSDTGNRVKIGNNISLSSVGNSLYTAIGSYSRVHGHGTAIGAYSDAGEYGVAIASGVINSVSATSGESAVAVGVQTNASGLFSVALGRGATAPSQGQFDISTGPRETSGYNNSNYRLLTGLYDPQNAHDAATKGYVDTKLGSLTLVSLTQSAYDALTTKDPNTLYIITGA